MRKHVIVAGLVAGLTLLGTAGCTDDVGPTPHSAESPTTGAPSVANEYLDRYFADDLAFYSGLLPAGAILALPPADVKAATGMATAVIVAEVVDVKPLRVIGDLQTVGVILRPMEVMRGQVRPDLTGTVAVEFPLAGATEPVAPEIARRRVTLPTGPSVWFLRWQGEPPPTPKPGLPRSTVADARFYSVVHMDSVFAQGETRVVSPIVEIPGEQLPEVGIRVDGTRFPRLSDLVAHIRAVR